MPTHLALILAAALTIGYAVHSLRLLSGARRHSRANAGKTGARIAEYADARYRDAQISIGIRSLVTLTLLLGGAAFLTQAVLAKAVPERGVREIAVALSILALMQLTELPAAILSTFGTERRFGFNRLSPAGLVQRQMLHFYGVAIYAGGATLVLTVIHFHFPDHGWLIAIPVFLILAQLVGRHSSNNSRGIGSDILPMKDGELKDRLSALATRAGLKSADLHIYKSTEHTLHTNAYIRGSGAGKQIILFDSLLQKLDAEELEAVVAHEIGHHLRRHIPIRLALTVLVRIPLLALVWGLAASSEHLASFGFTDNGAPPFCAALALGFILAAPLLHWANPLLSPIWRRHEYEADAEAARLTRNPQALIRALEKIHENSSLEPAPCPAFSSFYATHPSIEERRRALI